MAIPSNSRLPLYKIALAISAIYFKNGKGYLIKDLYRLITLSRSGDGAEYAFQLKENGYTGTNTGYLIDGRLPFWNIWSKNSPGKFIFYNNTSIRLGLKYDITSPVNPYYMASLGGFLGYNHQANEPKALCSNAVDGELKYYPSATYLKMVFTITTGEINWSEIRSFDKFYLRIVGILASGSETEIYLRESPEYVKTDGTTSSYNDTFDLSDFKIYTKLRTELHVGKTLSPGNVEKYKIPYIPSPELKLSVLPQGITFGNVLWFYKYSITPDGETVIIPNAASKIPVTNRSISFVTGSNYYLMSFNARISGDIYTEIPGYGMQSIQRYYDVLAQGVIYRTDGSIYTVNYENLGTLYLESELGYYNFNLPKTWSSSQFDYGTIHLFLRIRDI